MTSDLIRKSITFSLIFTLLIKVVFSEYSAVGLIAIFIFLQQLCLFILQLSTTIPFRSLFAVMMCLYMLLGPSMVYNGLEQYQFFKMKVNENDYFFYVMPAVILFILGLFFQSKSEGEKIDIKLISAFIERNKQLPFFLLGIGFASYFISYFFYGSITFVFYLIGSFQYVGLFLMLFGDYKFNMVWLLSVLAYAIGNALFFGMFNDLLTWMILGGAVICIKYKFSLKTRIIALISFCLLAIFIQTIKQSYREATWVGGQEASIETLQEASRKSQKSNSLLSLENLAPQVTRINQGWIIASIMDNVPRKQPFANGETIALYLKSALLPRFLAPDKLNAGDRAIFMKYTEVPITQGTSMAISSVGDAYCNFGIYGGWVFMFLYGYLFNFTLKLIGKYSKFYPSLVLFATIIFVYPIRPDCELQTILGHLLKSSFLVFIIFQLWKKEFRIKFLNA